MSFINPFSEVEHKVFKHTFLHRVVTNLEFANDSVSNETYWNAFKPFAQRLFYINNLPDKYPGDGTVNFNSDKTDTTFAFSSRKAYTSIGQIGYRSFEDTLQKHLEIINTFLDKVIQVKKIERLSIKKSNVWPFKIKDSQNNVKELLNFVFKEEHTTDLEYSKAEKGEIVRVCKEAKIDLKDNASLLINIGFEVENKDSVKVLLDTETTYIPTEGLLTTSIIPKAREINKIMFDAYMEVITSNIVDIMKKEDL